MSDVIPFHPRGLPAPPAIVLRYVTDWDPETGDKIVEAKAIDPATELPVAVLPLRLMAQWLGGNGYRWVFGSQGWWRRAA